MASTCTTSDTAEVMTPLREHRSAGQRLDDITKRMEAAYAERGKYPVGSPAWNAADDQVESVYVDLRAWNREVHGR